MNILKRPTLVEFWEKHPDCKDQLITWFKIAKSGQWQDVNQVKNSFPNTSILNDNRIVFNIKGNDYRLITKFNFKAQRCFIRWIGKHSDYDRINANSI